MATQLRQQKYPFGSLRKDPHWSVQGLVFYPNFRPAGKLIDESSGGNDGTIMGPMWTSEGLRFDGVSDYVEIPDNAILRFASATQDFSVFALVKSDVATPQDIVVDKRDGNDDGWVLRTVGGIVWLSINGIDIKGTIDIGDGQWHFIGAVANRSGSGQVYIDSVADGNPVDVSGQAMSTSVPMQLGITYVAGTEWAGWMKTIYIYNRALSAAEIQQLYINPDLPMQQDMGWMGFVAAAPPTGFKPYWALNNNRLIGAV